MSSHYFDFNHPDPQLTRRVAENIALVGGNRIGRDNHQRIGVRRIIKMQGGGAAFCYDVSTTG